MRARNLHIDEWSVEVQAQMQAQVPSKGVKVMCWARVLGDEVTDLFFPKEHPDSPSGHGVTTRTYLAMLEVALQQSVLDGSAIFVFDGATVVGQPLAPLTARHISPKAFLPCNQSLIRQTCLFSHCLCCQRASPIQAFTAWLDPLTEVSSTPTQHCVSNFTVGLYEQDDAREVSSSIPRMNILTIPPQAEFDASRQ